LIETKVKYASIAAEYDEEKLKWSEASVRVVDKDGGLSVARKSAKNKKDKKDKNDHVQLLDPYSTSSLQQRMEKSQVEFSSMNGRKDDSVSLSSSSTNIVKIVMSDGEYEGDAFTGVPHGYGRKNYSGFHSGQTYRGNWQNGLCHGHGLHTWPSGAKYEGDWESGKITGRGVYQYADGGSYEGDMVDGKSQGWGTYTYKSGRTYEGEFWNDKQHGLGIYRDADGSVLFSGRYVNGNREDGIKMTPDKKKKQIREEEEDIIRSLVANNSP